MTPQEIKERKITAYPSLVLKKKMSEFVENHNKNTDDILTISKLTTIAIAAYLKGVNR